MSLYPPQGEDRVRALADSAGLLLAARLMTVVGIPIAGFFGAWAFLTLVDLQVKVATITSQITTLVAKPYTADDASRDLAYVNNRIDNNSTDILQLRHDFQRTQSAIEIPRSKFP